MLNKSQNGGDTMHFRQLSQFLVHNKSRIIISILSIIISLAIGNAEINTKAEVSTNSPPDTTAEISSSVTLPYDESQEVTADVYLQTNKGLLKSNVQVTGKVGDSFSINIPTIDGYVYQNEEQPMINVKINEQKQAVSEDFFSEFLTLEEANKLSNTYENNYHSIKILTNIGQTIELTVQGYPGDDVKVNLPYFRGAYPNVNQITMHINDDGTLSTNDKIIYTSYNYKIYYNEEPSIRGYNGSSQFNFDKLTSTISFSTGQTTDDGFSILSALSPSNKINILHVKATDPASTVYLTGIGYPDGTFNPTDSDYAFGPVETFDTTGFSLKYEHSIASTFEYSKIKNLDLSVFNDNPNLKYADYTFADSAITTLNTNNFDVHAITTMENMFNNAINLKCLDLSTWKMDSIENTANMFDKSGLNKITLGSDNKFTQYTTLPTNSDEVWANVGNGTPENPQGNIIIKPKQELSTLYDGSGKTGTETFVRIKDSQQASRKITIKTNLGDKELTFNSDLNSDITIDVPKLDGYISNLSQINIHVDENGLTSSRDELVYSTNDSEIKVGDTITMPLYSQNDVYLGSVPSSAITSSQIDSLQKGQSICLTFQITIPTDIGSASYSSYNNNLMTGLSAKLVDGKIKMFYKNIPTTFIPVKIEKADVEFNYINNDTGETIHKLVIKDYDLWNASSINAPDLYSKSGIYLEGFIQNAFYTKNTDNLISYHEDNHPIDKVNSSLNEIIHQSVKLYNNKDVHYSTFNENIFVNNKLVNSISKKIYPYTTINLNGFDDTSSIPDGAIRNTDKSRFIYRFYNLYNAFDMSLNEMENYLKINSNLSFKELLLAMGVKEEIKEPSNSLTDVTINFHYDYDDPAASEITADLTIPSNKGNQIVKNLKGKIGDNIKVAIPYISGYSADKDFITATINDDGTLTTTENVTYTKLSSNSNHHNKSIENMNSDFKFTNENQLVSIHPDSGNIALYILKDNQFTISKTRALAANTNWFSDEYTDKDDERYYRVATTEWIKQSNAYPYIVFNNIYKTNDQFITPLINSRGETIKNRALGKSTSWLIDRIGYLGDYNNPIKAYRVATNEFVKSSN